MTYARYILFTVLYVAMVRFTPEYFSSVEATYLYLASGLIAGMCWCCVLCAQRITDGLEWTSAILCLVLGPFGILIAAVAFLTAFFLGRPNEDKIKDWLVALSGVRPECPTEQLFEKISAMNAREPERQRAAKVVSFNDVMKWGSISERQRALNQIVRNFGRHFVPPLKTALADKTNVVRVQAASTIAALEGQYLEQELRLAQRSAARPNNIHLESILAVHRLTRANTGLLDQVTEEQTRAKGIETLLGLFVKIPPGKKTLLGFERELIDGLLASNRLLDARSVLRHLLLCEKSRSPETIRHVVRWLFLKKRYSVISRYVRASSKDNETLIHEHAFWLQEEPHQFDSAGEAITA